MSTIQHTLTRGGRYGGAGDHHFAVDYGRGFIVQHYLSDREWQELRSPDQITITVTVPTDAASVEHVLTGEIGRQHCTCGWEPLVGESVRRAFDKHLLAQCPTTPAPLDAREGEEA